MSDILVGYFTASKQLNHIQIAGHGLLNGDTVRFTLGATGNTLPAPLVEGTWYYVIGAASDAFQVSGTSGGAAVVLTDEGTGSNEAWSPAPTENVWAYEILTSENSFTPELTEVNLYAQRGWELSDMQQIGGGAEKGRFWYLMRKQEPAGA
jgi:hypothetical protein